VPSKPKRLSSTSAPFELVLTVRRITRPAGSRVAVVVVVPLLVTVACSLGS